MFHPPLRLIAHALMCMLLLPFLLRSVQSVSASSTNLLANPGFESGVTGWAENWGNAAVVTNNVRTGTKALQVGTGTGGLAQPFAFKTTTDYTLTGWAKRSASGVNAAIGILFRDAQGNFIQNTYTAVTSTSSYTKLTVKVTSPAEFASAVVYVDKSTSGGYVYADDLALLEGSGGRTLYVKPTGNNTNSGLSEQLAWKTVAYAAQQAQAGDTVVILAGTYNERVIMSNTGAFGATITLKAKPGSNVIIDGTGIVGPGELAGLVEVRGKRYVRIEGLKVRNADGDGIGVFGPNSSHITVIGNSTYNTTNSGIAAWGNPDVVQAGSLTNLVIENNRVELANNPSPTNDGWQENITIASGVDQFIVRNNEVLNSGNQGGAEGIDAKFGVRYGRIYGNYVHDLNVTEEPRANGIYIDAYSDYATNIEVFNNRVQRITGTGIAFGTERGGTIDTVSIYNNIVTDSMWDGIGFGDYHEPDTQNGPKRNLSIINNTVYRNGYNTLSAEPYSGINLGDPTATNIIVRNNIVSQNNQAQIYARVTTQPWIIENNLIDGFRGASYQDPGDPSVALQEIRGSNPIDCGGQNSCSPQFVNAATEDFHLLSNSPAIDAGTATGAPAFDFDRTSRPQGPANRYDVGAYEFR